MSSERAFTDPARGYNKTFLIQTLIGVLVKELKIKIVDLIGELSTLEQVLRLQIRCSSATMLSTPVDNIVPKSHPIWSLSTWTNQKPISKHQIIEFNIDQLISV